MTSNPDEMLRQIARRIPVPEPAYERMLLRRDRLRRHQRIKAGAVGMTIFTASAFLIAIAIGPLGQPLAPVGGPKGPTASLGPRWGGVGIPPVGTPLSTPARGELIAEANTVFRVGSVSAYADGRVAWLTNGSPYPMERRLTPAGVELVRSGAVNAQDLFPPQVLHGLPTSAWADQAKPYAPARFAICGIDPADMDLLPASAQALLHGKKRDFQGDGLLYDPDQFVECFEVTTDDARALDGVLRKAGLTAGETGPVTAAEWRLRDAQGHRVVIDFMRLFPDGRWHTAGGG